MLQVLKTSTEAPCISVTDKSLNTTALVISYPNVTFYTAF